MPDTPTAPAVEKAFRARTDLVESFGTNARLLFALQLRFDIEDVHAVAREALVDGPDDKGCDLVYLDPNSRKLIIAQGYEAANAAKGTVAKASKASALSHATHWLLCGDVTRLNDRLRPVATEARTAIGDGEVDAIELWYVHNRPESPQVQDELRMAESAARNALRDGFDPGKIPQDVSALEVGMGTQESWYRSLAAPILVNETITLDVPGYFEVSGDQWRAVVTAIPARRLRELYEQHKSDLFSANYRDYLGASRSRKREDINKFIRETAEGDPGKFWVFNNGVSAIVHRYEVRGGENGKATLILEGMSIVNGAQTTGSLGSLHRPPDDKAMVPFRFIHCTDGDTIADIVRYNNSQNPLMPSDYKSNDDVQRRLREEFKQLPKSKYTGGRRGLPVDRVAPPGDLMPTDTCAQALAAFHQRPDVAYHQKAAVWQDDTLYREFFCEKTTARHIVFAYSLLKCIEERKKALPEPGTPRGRAAARPADPAGVLQPARLIAPARLGHRPVTRDRPLPFDPELVGTGLPFERRPGRGHRRLVAHRGSSAAPVHPPSLSGREQHPGPDTDTPGYRSFLCDGEFPQGRLGDVVRRVRGEGGPPRSVNATRMQQKRHR